MNFGVKVSDRDMSRDEREVWTMAIISVFAAYVKTVLSSSNKQGSRGILCWEFDYEEEIEMDQGGEEIWWHNPLLWHL